MSKELEFYIKAYKFGYGHNLQTALWRCWLWILLPAELCDILKTNCPETVTSSDWPFFCIARDFLLFQMPDFHPHINSACKKRDFLCEICCCRAFACSFIFLGWFVWLLKFYSAFCRQGFYIIWWYVYGWGLYFRGLCYWRHSCPVVIFGWFYFETSTE